MYLYFVDKIVQEKGSLFGLPLFESRLVELGIGGRVEKMSMFKDSRSMVQDLIKGGELQTIIAVGSDETFFTVFDMAAQYENLTLGFVPAVEGTLMQRILNTGSGLDACATIGRRLTRTLDVGEIELGSGERRLFFGGIILPDGAHVRCDDAFDITTDAKSETQVTIENVGVLEHLAAGQSELSANYHDGKIEVSARAMQKKKSGLFGSKQAIEHSVFFCDSVRARAGAGKTSECIIDGNATISLPFTVTSHRERLKLVVGKESPLQ